MKSKISQAFEGLAIEDESLSEKAASLIRKKIISGAFASGERLTENDFALALGISRACVREAFQTLENEGLIKKKVNKYTEVVDLTQADIEEIYRLRAAIEACCLETALAGGTLPLDKLGEEADRISQRFAVSAEQQDDASWIDADFAFHEMIVLSSGNTRAIDAWFRLKNQAMLVLYNASLHHWKPRTADHRELAEAIRNEPLPAACERIRRHIMIGYEALEKWMQEKKG